MVEATSNQMSVSHHQDYADTNDPEVIRAQIEQTRAQMTQTVNSIQERLSPERLTREAKDKIKEATIGKVEEMADVATYKANRWRNNLVDTMKQNPIPTALVGIGLGWLLMEGMRSSDREEYTYHHSVYDYDNQRLYTPENYYEGSYTGTERSTMENVQHRMSDAAHTVQDKTSRAVQGAKETASNMAATVSDKAGNVAATVTDTASNVASTVTDTASNVAHTVTDTAKDMSYRAQEKMRYQAQRAKSNFQYMLEENPLAVGAVAIAAGATLGLMLPSTQKEDELMGDTRDNLIEQAKTTAKETAQKAQHVANEAYESAKETVKDEAEKEGLTTGSHSQSQTRL
jgi:hypothetical protein